MDSMNFTQADLRREYQRGKVDGEADRQKILDEFEAYVAFIKAKERAKGLPQDG